ncbi:MAG: hypothetical protein K1X89_22125 [Myxococcaceae bacterium]|nr:hypothetical protein [Myxococcaceae bacterium]
MRGLWVAVALAAAGCAVGRSVEVKDAPGLARLKGTRLAITRLDFIGLRSPGESIVGPGPTFLDANLGATELRPLEADGVRLLEKTLVELTVAQYVSMTELKPPAGQLDAAEVNQLGTQLHGTINFTVVPGWQKRLAVNSEWTLLDAQGRRVWWGRLVHADDWPVEARLPDPTDPKYEPIWHRLLGETTADLQQTLTAALSEPHG